MLDFLIGTVAKDLMVVFGISLVANIGKELRGKIKKGGQ